jgi:predicted peptidase
MARDSLFLHGIGEKGNGTTDLIKVLKNGPPKLVAAGKKIPAIIIAPQSNDGWFYPEFIGGMREDGSTHVINET